MNKLHTTAANMQVQAISIGQIILDDSNYLTLWGKVLQADGAWKTCDLVTTYEVMNTMLRFSLDKHEAVQMSIVHKLETMCRVPDIIDLEAELGNPVVFDNLVFQLQSPAGDLDAYTEDLCYFIESVAACPATPAKEETCALNDKAAAIDYGVKLLADTYNLYLGYVEVELEEGVARLKAGLEDDNRFSMAYYAWQFYTSKG